MKKSILFILLVALSAVFVSWGYKGHQVVARIAENHLTPQARAAVHNLLGSESMADVSSWADDIRNDHRYTTVEVYHYINVPGDLTYEEFSKQVKAQKWGNAYYGIIDAVRTLKLNNVEPARIAALKFLIHYVGDIHQPMHVSRKEDKGGNMIQLRYDGRGTNLHSLWDTRLIDEEDKSTAHLAAEIDRPGKFSADPMQWAWESYQLSNKLYGEVRSGDQLGDQYYKDHIQLVNERLNAAGHRLAALLNEIFADYKGEPAAAGEVRQEVPANSPIVDDLLALKVFNVPGDDIKPYIGRNIRLNVQGKVFSHKDLGGMTLVNVGGDYPDQLLTVVLEGDAREKAGTLDGKTVMFVGPLIDYKGRPEIIVNDPSNIQPVVFK